MPNETRSRAKKADRQAQILLELQHSSHVRIVDLAARFDVTPETIRRDLGLLHRGGHLHRAYGGATAPLPGTQRDLEKRQGEHLAERVRIARHAAGLVAAGDTLMIDAGSTTIEFARQLAILGTPVTAITNAPQVASLLGQTTGSEIIVAPGRYLPAEAALVGPDTVEYLARFRVARCYLGASAFSAEGITEAVSGFEAVKRAMLKASRKSCFLIDSSKQGLTHLARVADLDQVDMVITDKALPSALEALCRSHGLDIVVP